MVKVMKWCAINCDHKILSHCLSMHTCGKAKKKTGCHNGTPKGPLKVQPDQEGVLII